LPRSTRISTGVCSLKKPLVYSLLAAICVANFIWIMRLNSLYCLPPGSDSFHWLMHAKALLEGVGFPMWDEGLWQYPPLSLVSLGLFAKLFGDLLGLKLFGALVLAFLPASFFVLVRKMFGSRVGIVAAAFMAITPIFYEMWGYGMYPNLFGFSILFLTLFTVIKFMEQRNRKWGIIAIAMSVVLMFSHHLTSIVYLVTMLLWTVLCLATKQRIRELALVSVAALVTFGLYRTIVSPQFNVFNPSTLFVLPMDYDRFLWVFKHISIFIVTGLCVVYTFYRSYKDKPSYSLMLISLVVASFALTYGLPLIRIVLDQARFLIFSLPAFIIGVAYLIREIKPSARIKSLAIIIVVVVLLSVSGYIGVRTSWEINRFTRCSSAEITTAQCDRDIREMVDWVKANTDERDVFVAEQYLSKPIMGLGERRALEAINPAYLFMEGEIQRSLVADSLLNANYEINHPSFRVRDQYPLQNHNPIIGLWERGYYHDIVYFSDEFLQVELIQDGQTYLELARPELSECESPLFVSYFNPHVIIRRTVDIEEGGVRIIFSAEPRGQDVTLVSMTIYGWRPWHNHNLREIVFSESELILVDDDINARIIPQNYAQLDYYLADPIYGQAGFKATFEPENNYIIGEFFIPYRYLAEDSPQMFEAEKLIEAYGVSYLAVLNGAERQTWFLENNGYTIVYRNSSITIYSARQG